MIPGALFLILIIFSCSPVYGEEILFLHQDKTDDGSYEYPRHEHFYPHSGLFDLQEFRVRSGENHYFFDFTLGAITDPWDSFFGFSHPLFHLYIDNEEGGSTEPVKPVLEVKMSSDYPWNRALIFCGWWIKGMEAGEEWRSPQEEISWDSPRPPSLEGSSLKVEDNTITLGVEASWIGELENARYYVLVGSYDPLENYYFRPVTLEASSWTFGGGEEPEGNLPIIDVLLPEGVDQRAVLASSRPVLQPVGTPDPALIGEREVMLILILLGLGLLGVYLYRTKKEF